MHKLRIYGAMIEDLPAGPYLRRLDSLDFEKCAFVAGVPVSLAAAAQLRHLGLSPGDAYRRAHQVCLSVVDVAVPALATLVLRKPREWEEYLWEFLLDRLREACTSKGRVPPSISE